MVLDKIKTDVKNDDYYGEEYKNVYARHKDNMILFNYKQGVFDLNELEEYCRGLILDTDGNILSRPFEKFYNWGENNKYPQSKIKYIMEKIDGSLGILSFKNSEWTFTTRGGFETEQALWAQNYFKNIEWNYPTNYTYLFEIVYDDNQVLINYMVEQYGLYLLAIRENETGKYYDLYELLEFYANLNSDFIFLPEIIRLPELPTIDTQYDFINSMLNDKEIEGFVVVCEDETRFKIKTEWYRELHRISENVNYKNIAHLILENKYDDLEAVLPEYKKMHAVALKDKIVHERSELYHDVVRDFNIEMPLITEQDKTKEHKKAFALAVEKYPKQKQHFLWQVYLERDLYSEILLYLMKRGEKKSEIDMGAK